VTVGEVLEELRVRAAGIESRLFKGPGVLNRFVNVYLNDEDVRFLKNLETPVKEGDEVSIVPAIAGGRPLAACGRVFAGRGRGIGGPVLGRGVPCHGAQDFEAGRTRQVRTGFDVRFDSVTYFVAR
jgi:sulfur-carrier protein